jgi:hypothetical protein
MNPNPIRNGPVFEGPYVPYFYQAGLYRVQPIAPGGRAQSPAGRSYAVYDFASEANPWTPSREPQTVEQIIERGYFAAPRSEPELALISDRQHTSRLGLEDTIQLIRQRYEVYQKNVYDIEVSKCSAIIATRSGQVVLYQLADAVEELSAPEEHPLAAEGGRGPRAARQRT